MTPVGGGFKDFVVGSPQSLKPHISRFKDSTRSLVIWGMGWNDTTALMIQELNQLFFMGNVLMDPQGKLANFLPNSRFSFRWVSASAKPWFSVNMHSQQFTQKGSEMYIRYHACTSPYKYDKHIRYRAVQMCIYRCTYSTYMHIDTPFCFNFILVPREFFRHWPVWLFRCSFCVWPEAKPYVFRVLSTSSSFARTMRSRSLNAIYELVDHCPSFPRPTMWTWDLTRNCGWFDLYGGVGFCQVQAIQIGDG